MKTKLEVSLRGFHAILRADGFYGRVAKAFQTTGSSDEITLPPPVRSMCRTPPFVGQHLKGGARFYLVKCEEGLSSSPNITIDVFIYTDEEDPKPEACVRDFCKRVKKARIRDCGLRYELPNRFYVYPLIDGCSASSDDVSFCFLATRESKWSWRRILAVSVLAYAASPCFCGTRSSSFSPAIA